MSDVVTALAEVVDEFGVLKQQIAELEEKEKALRDRLISSGLRLIVGNRFVITLSEKPRRTTDWKSVMEKAAVDQSIVDSFTESKQVTYVTCTVKE